MHSVLSSMRTVANYSRFVKVSLFILLGVRSLANASRTRQFNPLHPPGVGWVPLPQTNMAAVVGRARSCVVGRARSCVVGRARSCVVVRGRSCVVVPFCKLRGQHCRAACFAASTAVTRTNEGTNERTTSNNPLNPPGVGWVKFVYPIKVRVSMVWAHACQIWERSDGRLEKFVFQIYK